MRVFSRIAGKWVPVLRVLLGGLFTYAGFGKLANIPAFAANLERFGVSDPVLSSIVAHYLPCVEIVCGLALVWRRCTIGAATLFVGLLIVFEAGLAWVWAAGVQADCGCFGTLFGGATVPAAFLRNLGLLAIAALVLWREWCFSARRIP